jgi:hypothetical protein
MSERGYGLARLLSPEGGPSLRNDKNCPKLSEADARRLEEREERRTSSRRPTKSRTTDSQRAKNAERR